MTTKELIKIVHGRGLRIVLKEGQPILVRPDGNTGVTDKLLAVLKIHREWIIEILSANNGVTDDQARIH